MKEFNQAQVDIPLPASAVVQGGWTLYVENATGRVTGDWVGGINHIHGYTQLYQRGDEGGAAQHRSTDDLVGATKIGVYMELLIYTKTERRVYPSKVSTPTVRWGKRPSRS